MNKDDLLLEAAILYYQENLTQNEIAKRIHVSRPTVSNLIKEARDKGIVKLTIQHPRSDFIEQQDALKRKYALKNVIIIKAEEDNKRNKEKIGEACANFVERHIHNYKSIGIGWGTTMYEFVNAASYVNTDSLEIVPLMGGLVSRIHTYILTT